MGRIDYINEGAIKRVRINLTPKLFLIIFSLSFIILLVIFYLSGVSIENKHSLLKGVSQTTLYLIAIALLFVINMVLISPKIEFILDSSSGNLILKKTNFIFIKTEYSFSKDDKVYLIGKKKLSIIVSIEEGLVRAYNPFLRYYKDGEEINIKLFPWIGIFYIQKFDWDNFYSLTKSELEKIASFLNIKLLIE